MGQSWNLSGRTALATLAGLAVLEGLGGPVWAAPSPNRPAPSPAAAASRSPRRVSVDFVEAELGDIVKALSVQSGVNVAVASGVKGKVTVRLKGTTLEEALRLVSRMANVDYKQINGTYVVGPMDDLRALAARSGVTETFAPRYLPLADAKELAQSTAPYVVVEARTQSGQLLLRGLPEDVTMARSALAAADVTSAAPRTSTVVTPSKLKPKALAELLNKALPELKCSIQERSLILTGTTSELQLAQEVVKGADVPSGVARVTRIYQLKFLHPTQATDLLTKTFPGLTVTPGAEPLAPNAGAFAPLSLDSSKSFKTQAVSSNEGSNGLGSSNGQTKSRTLILVGIEEDLAAGMALLDQTDLAPPQVMIEARVVESSPEVFKNVGLEWNFGQFNISGAGGRGLRIGQVMNGGFNFDATINALIQNRNAKILAEPKIAVIDGEDASIFIGDTFRYRVLASITDGGQQLFDVREVPVGIVLLCRPRVNTDGMVTLKVNPVVSTITSFFGPERIPQTASREANSTIRVRDGETVAIGGLIRDEDRQTISKVPLLGDLPLVGQLFRNTFREKRRTDVTIFLTTRIVK
jgi:general secretion pathway protein D